ICAVIAAALVGVVPYSGLINGNATSDTLALLPLWSLQDTVTTLDEVGAVVLAVAIAFAVLLLLVPVRLALVLPLAVFALYAVALWPIETNPNGGIQHASLGALFGGTSSPKRDWIDERLGHKANVAVLFDSRTMDKFTVWTNEFFNRSVEGVYDLAGPTPGGLPETPVTIDPQSGRIARIVAPYVLTSLALQLDEPAAFQDRVRGLAVYRVVRPLGIKSTTTGIYGDSWSGARASYTRYRCRSGETLLATVAGDAKLIRAVSTLTVTSGRRRLSFSIPYRRVRTVRIPLAPDRSRCVVRFAVAPVAQPAAVEPPSTDTRVLGLRFLAFAVR
ncbi:MAG TPA: hypothetical protein VMU73_07610, partial [Gaiellaceae bacterium]|nr:hypothetical protein [Gaiellaceae bacterium]